MSNPLGLRLSSRWYLAPVLLSLAVLLAGVLSLPILGVLACATGILRAAWHCLSPYVAVAVSVLLPLLSAALVVTWSYFQPVSFTLLIDAIYLVIIWATAFRGAWRGSANDVPHVSWLSLSAASIPAVVTLITLFAGGNLFGLNLGWVLAGDAQNNTVSNVLIVESNGANPIFTAAPALIQLLMSAAIAGTLGFGIAAADFVAIIQVQALVLALMWVAASVVFGLVADREFRRHRPAVRAIASIAGAVLPLTWFILGFSITAGFYNTAAAVLALGMTWLLWREQETIAAGSRWMIVSGLLLVTLFAAMAWVPLALIPGVMVAAIVARAFWVDRRASEMLNWPVVTSAVFLVLYAAAIVVPSFLGHGDSLGSDGWMTELPKALVVIAMLLGVISALLFGGKVAARGSAAAGLLLMIVAAGLGLAFLMYSASHTGALWAYYPRKFAWMTTFAIMCIATLVALGSRTFAGLRPRWAQAVGATSVLLVLGIGLLQVPFSQIGPLKVFPLLNVAATGQDITGAVPAIAETVGTKTIRLEYDENDFIVNQWAFQWGSAHELMWGYAYSLIQNPEDVCSAAQTWGGGVTLLTHSADARESVLSQCGNLIAEVRGAETP